MTGKKQDKPDDMIERLNFFWTCTVLVVFIFCVGILRYIFPTSAMTCWAPSQFEASQIEYTHRVCWYTDNQHVIEQTQIRSGKLNVANAPFVFILMMMLAGFKIPQLFKMLADVFNNMKSRPVRDTNRHELDQLVVMVKESIVYRSNFRFVFLLIVKALLVLNLFIQFVFVTTYFRDTTITETISTRNASGFNENVTLEKTLYYIFPKTVHCSFEIRHVSNLHNYDLQCDIPIHYLYEMFFKLYWFWILVLGVYTFIAAVTQSACLLVQPLKELAFGSIMTNAREASVDTLLILRGIEYVYGTLMTRRITSQLKLSSSNAVAMKSDPDEIPLMMIQQSEETEPHEKHTVNT